MNKNDIYVGTIKKCLDLDKYKKYGKSFLEPMSKPDLNSTIIVHIEQAILIKTTHGYVRIEDLGRLFVNTKLKYELFDYILFDEPEQSGDLFVDNSTLIPYYNEKVDTYISVKTLKKQLLLDSRIKGGIEH